MKKYYTDKRSLSFLRVFTLILVICIVIILKYSLYYFISKYPKYFEPIQITLPEIAVWSLIALFVIAYVLFIMIILPLWYSSASYAVSSDEIVVRYGVFSKIRQYMRLSAVQYITHVSFPFSRITGFNFIVINALGGKIVLMFLSDRDATEISAKIDKAVRNWGAVL